MISEISTLKTNQKARLILEDGTVFEGSSFGFKRSVAGEVVFNTGMMGYPETLTDPSYFGQILTFTYPLIGNYGVPAEKGRQQLSSVLESRSIQISALLVSDYSQEYNHWNSQKSLSQWLTEHEIPALFDIDTRVLTKILREKGTMPGKLVFDETDIPFWDPNHENLVENCSIKQPVNYGKGSKTIALLDCGCKHNIIHSLLKRNVRVLRLPWNYDISKIRYHGLVISNGPGDPKMCRQTILQIRKAIAENKPVFGICLGHQLMALAAGANTYKLKYGHRSQNQPVMEMNSRKCLITSQNHGFAVDNQTLPAEWEPWFINLNDQTNEGIRHVSGRFMSVQFHPEASPGPSDADFLFDEFLKVVNL
ncbi:MAG: glutamine-hydrolyzing carbamoyl-phosphate synthase small subunit [Calditrichaeota bacterium]|nr:glutamine-hydrolyzing carbamoyl-phosphate synthase small subunit [Calditrichota bacterium]